MRKILTLLLTICLGTANLAAQTNKADSTAAMPIPEITASYMVASPGKAFVSAAGHAFMRMQCPEHHLDVCFSSESNGINYFTTATLFNHMRQGLVCVPTQQFLKEFTDAGRGITQYNLNLTPAEKQRLWYLLDKTVQKGMCQPLDYLNNGCTYECFRMVNQALTHDEMRYDQVPAILQESRRHIIDSKIQCKPWSTFFIALISGTEHDTDCPFAQKLIVPEHLAQLWSHTTLISAEGNERPMCLGKPITVAPIAPDAGWSINPTLLCIIILITAVTLSVLNLKGKALKVGKMADVLLFTVQTIFALLLTHILFVTDYVSTAWNWLYLQYNPLPALLLAVTYALHRPLPLVWKRKMYGAVSLLLVVYLVGSFIQPPTSALAHLSLAATFAVRTLYHWAALKTKD